MPPLARIAQLYEHIPNDRRDDLADVLRIADEFNARLATEEFRELAKRARDEVVRRCALDLPGQSASLRWCSVEVV